MKFRLLLLCCFLVAPWVKSHGSGVVSTGIGKVKYAQGHQAPACRTVQFQDTATSTVKNFRIKADDGADDIQTIALAALMSNRDVEIFYDESITSGCGTEPAISFIVIY